MRRSGARSPFRAIVRAMPNLKDKQMFLKDMDAQTAEEARAGQVAQATQELQLRGAQAKVVENPLLMTK
jgi:hypothetical protein